MSPIQETLFDLLINLILQISFFAIGAVVFSRLVAKARAKHQHCFYLAVLFFCLAVPIINTLWQAPSTVVAEKSQLQVSSKAGAAKDLFWNWQGHSKQRGRFTIAPGFQSWIVGVWGDAGSASAGPLLPSCAPSSSAAGRRIRTFSRPTWDGQADHRARGCSA
jgi:hypothetical protein